MEEINRKDYKVSVVVPTFNEEDTLDEVLKSVKGYGDELFVIDGHSTDKTHEIAKQNGVDVHLDRGKGKGDGLRKALEIAKHPIVVFIDADGSHVPEDIPKLVEPIKNNEAEMVIGSRMAGGSDELFSDFIEFIRLNGSMIINLAINYRWNVRLSDTQNGFRAMLRDAANHVGLRANITTIEQEMAMKMLNHGYRVMNVPSHEYSRKGGASKISVRKVWFQYIWNMFRYTWVLSEKKKFKQF